MWLNPQETTDLVTFTEEILNGKLHFLCSLIESWNYAKLQNWGFKCLKNFSLVIRNDPKEKKGSPSSLCDKKSHLVSFLCNVRRSLVTLSTSYERKWKFPNKEMRGQRGKTRLCFGSERQFSGQNWIFSNYSTPVCRIGSTFDNSYFPVSGSYYSKCIF